MKELPSIYVRTGQMRLANVDHRMEKFISIWRGGRVELLAEDHTEVMNATARAVIERALADPDPAGDRVTIHQLRDGSVIVEEWEDRLDEPIQVSHRPDALSDRVGWYLSWLLPIDAQPVIGDLIEKYVEDVLPTRGPVLAGRWLIWQAFTIAWRSPLLRLLAAVGAAWKLFRG